MYADNTAVQKGIPLQTTFRTLWGRNSCLKGENKSKIRVSVCVQEEIWSKNAEIFDNVNLNPDIFADGSFIPIVNKFIYLRLYLTRDCRDDMDVKERIYVDGGAFGNLRDCLFSFPKISPDAKIIAYIELIFSILLYDSECWSLTEKLACCYHCGCQVDQEAALNLSMAEADENLPEVRACPESWRLA